MELKIKTLEEKIYISPNMEVIEIEIGQNVLLSTSGDGMEVEGEWW